MSEVKRKSVAELLESPHVKPMERTIPVCVAGELVGKYERLEYEYLEARDRDGGTGERSNRRDADGASEALLIAQRQEKLREEMLAHEVLVRLRRDRAKWRAFTTEHPPRVQDSKHTAYCPAARVAEDDDEKPTCTGCLPNLDDNRHGVNIDALADDAGDWVVALNDEKAGRSEFDQIVARPASDGDLREVARRLAGMHEGVSTVPKSRLALHNESMSDDDSKQPERSA